MLGKQDRQSIFHREIKNSEGQDEAKAPQLVAAGNTASLGCTLHFTFVMKASPGKRTQTCMKEHQLGTPPGPSLAWAALLRPRRHKAIRKSELALLRDGWSGEQASPKSWHLSVSQQKRALRRRNGSLHGNTQPNGELFVPKTKKPSTLDLLH